MNAYIFVSYSRDDEPFVTQIVRLLRAAIAGVHSVDGKQWVFQDTDHLNVGERWEGQIDEAISRAERIFVFWCKHSSQSNQVRREYELGLQIAKVVIPVLIDDTPLPAILARIHGIDLRELGIHGPQIRHMFPRPGERSPQQIIAEEFGNVLGIDPQALMMNFLMRELRGL